MIFRDVMWGMGGARGSRTHLSSYVRTEVTSRIPAFRMVSYCLWGQCFERLCFTQSDLGDTSSSPSSSVTAVGSGEASSLLQIKPNQGIK